MPTSERLRELLYYDPDTGVCKWRVRVAHRVHVGDIAGHINLGRRSGYWKVSIDDCSYPLHRVIWLYMTGKWPKHQIDHINGNRADNRWVNLREATNSQNGRNATANSKNTSWFKGVHWMWRHRKWAARVAANEGKRIFLGLFDAPHQAYAVYCLAARKYHGEFARCYEPDQLIIPRKVFEERVLRNLLIATQPTYEVAA